MDSDGNPRDGAQVAELTAWMPAPTKPTRSPARFGPQHWPEGMRVIARRERPHPGAQLRLTDHDGWRITCFTTNTRGPGWTLPALEVRHRLRARAEDRIRGLIDAGLRNLPFHGYAHNQIWLEIVALAADLLAWTQTRLPAAGPRTTSSTPAGQPCSKPKTPTPSTSTQDLGEPTTTASALTAASTRGPLNTTRQDQLTRAGETSRLGADWLFRGRADVRVVVEYVIRVPRSLDLGKPRVLVLAVGGDDTIGVVVGDEVDVGT